MTQKKKVIFVIPSLEGGGAECIFVNLLIGLDRVVYDPVVVLFNKKGVFIDLLPEGIRVIDLKKTDRWSFIPLILRLSCVLKAETPELVVSFITYANYITIIARRFSGLNIPVVAAEHCVVSRTIKGRFETLKKFIISAIYPRADAIIVVSHGCKNELIKKYGVPEKKLVVIPNGINLDRVKLRAEEKVDHAWFMEHVPIIVSIGRLTPAKNYRLLLNSVAQVNKTLDVRLVIIGDGEERGELVTVARELGIEDKVLFLGYQINPYKFLAKSSLFVISSSWESFSIAIVEAMSLGIPVIATDCPYGPAEIITNYVDGVLVPCDDSVVLCHKIIELLRDKGVLMRISKNAALASQKFSSDIMLRKYNSVFNGVGL